MNQKFISHSILLIIFISIFLFSCTKEVDFDSLVERNGIKYEVNSDEGYTGNSVGFHENGQKAVQCSFIDGELNGNYSEWYENGQLKLNVTYRNGSVVDMKSEFWMNGNKKATAEYANGKRNGESLTFKENGTVSKREEYLNDSLHGEVIELWTDSTIISTGKYSHGRKVGEHVFSDSLGNLLTKSQYDSTGKIQNSKFYLLSDDNQVQMYREVDYTDGIITKEYRYDDGMLLGETIDSTGLGIDFKRYKYFYDGELFINNVVRSGWVEKYWDWKGGGVARKYQVTAESGFIKHGKYYEYDENGNLYIEGNFDLDERSGLWKWYDRHGQVTSRQYY